MEEIYYVSVFSACFSIDSVFDGEQAIRGKKFPGIIFAVSLIFKPSTGMDHDR